MGMTVINSGFHLETEEDHTVELLDVLLNGLPVPLSEKREKAIETIRVPWDFSSLQLKVLLNEEMCFVKTFSGLILKESGRTWLISIPTLWLLIIYR